MLTRFRSMSHCFLSLTSVRSQNMTGPQCYPCILRYDHVRSLQNLIIVE